MGDWGECWDWTDYIERKDMCSIKWGNLVDGHPMLIRFFCVCDVKGPWEYYVQGTSSRDSIWHHQRGWPSTRLDGRSAKEFTVTFCVNNEPPHHLQILRIPLPKTIQIKIHTSVPSILLLDSGIWWSGEEDLREKFNKKLSEGPYFSRFCCFNKKVSS